MKKLSTLLIVIGILIASFPIYQLAYSYYWESKLLGEMDTLDQAYADLNNEDTANETKQTVTGAANDFTKSQTNGAPDTNPTNGSRGDGTNETTSSTSENSGQESTQTQVAPSTKTSGTLKTIGTLIIPKIDLKLPIVAGISKSNLNKGAAWMSDSGKLGQNGNAVIAGHRGYSRGRLFNRLNEIKVDDTFSIKTKNGTLSYQVYEVKIVLPSETSVLAQPRSKEIITLITCTPLRVSTHRIIIKAERIK